VIAKGNFMEKTSAIIEAIAHDKNIAIERAKRAFKEALINTAKRLEGRECMFEVVEDAKKDRVDIYRVLNIVADDDPLLEEQPEVYISLTEAQEYGDVEIGDHLRLEFDLEEYGHTGAANFYKELEYHLQRNIEQELFDKYKEKVGTIVLGTVNQIDADDNTYVEIGELRGILTQRNRIKGEQFKVGDSIKALLKFVRVDPKTGMSLELTRTAPKFLELLMEKEVPEIEDGDVEIVSSARIPGERAKVALMTDRMNIDPVGAAVGSSGVRINAVSKELNGENIDCIEYSPIPEIYISRALSPAVIKSVKVVSNTEDDKRVIVDVTSDQKAKAIGKSGINIRLASMLTKFAIELNDVEGNVAATETNEEQVTKTSDTSALEDLFK
jgi:N utilization substance protein A